jgi:hypothetical protein
MKYTINRFEGTIAVCEDEQKTMISIPKYRLPLEAKEGDVIEEVNGMFEIDDFESNELRKKTKQLMNKLFEN